MKFSFSQAKPKFKSQNAISTLRTTQELFNNPLSNATFSSQKIVPVSMTKKDLKINYNKETKITPFVKSALKKIILRLIEEIIYRRLRCTFFAPSFIVHAYKK